MKKFTVNLFDDCFRHAACSSGWQTPQHIRYVRDQMAFDGITLFTDGYVNSPIVDEVQSKYKIGWLHEPQCLHPENYLVAQPERFDFILTYFEPLLAQGPIKKAGSDWAYPFRFCPYGGIWIDRLEWGGSRGKTRLVSMLSGDKLATTGHVIRREIADWAATQPGVIDLYGYQGRAVNYSPQTKLESLGPYCFSIVTETCRQDNLFTEWLLDCFAVLTVPIFWGCPNVGDFFDTDGILSFETVEGCQAIVRALSVDLYRSMAGAIRANYETVQEYAVTEDWIYLNVLRELEL